MTIHEEVLRSLANWGKHPAIIEIAPGKPDRLLTAADLAQDIKDLTAYLQKAGIRAGTPTALFLQSSVEFIEHFLALSRLGAVSILSKLEYRKLENEEIFANSKPQALIVEKQFLTAISGYVRDQTVITQDNGVLQIAQAADRDLMPAEVDPDIASINYTYRGYGYPLAALIPHVQYLHGARVFQELTQGSPGQKVLSSLPMSHIFTIVGCLLVPLLNRMTVVIARTIQPRLLFKAISEYHIDNVIAVPEILGFLARLKDPELILTSLKLLVSGGSVLSEGDYCLLQQVFGVEVLHGYGLTEFAPVSGHIRGKARAGTIGPPTREIEARIDSQGEILIKSPYLFRGYYRRPAESQGVLRDGWFCTGDLGRFDGEHLVFVHEKKKTCKVNGSLADLEEIRQAILLDPDIAEAEVLFEGGDIVARIVPGSGQVLQQKGVNLAKSLKGIIADYKIPKRVIGL